MPTAIAGLTIIFDRYNISDVDAATDPKYYGYIDKDGNWYIMKAIENIRVLKLDKTNGFADPVPSDIGKMVQDDSADVGPLVAYEIDPSGADTGKWWIRTTKTITDSSAMTITGGTGAGTADGDSVTGGDIYRYACGSSDYTANWAIRDELTYNYYDVEF